MRIIELYINDKKADLTDSLSLPITYQQENLSNPTDIKVAYSKTIVLPGTSNNDNIFNNIFNLDSIQFGDFDPSKRVDAMILIDGNIFESGYIQLVKINELNHYRTYEVNFYGGLGDFFYGLKYKEDGTIKTLADLVYGIQDESGNVLPPDTELNFNINKDFVYNCWTRDLSRDNNTIYDFINFMPAYNGLYENFDNSTCLINAAGTGFDTTKTDGGVTYGLKNGYSLAKLNNQYTEWEAGDLRSYKQRPVVKLSKIIDGICDNSGYNVVRESSFFNPDNPYWSKTYIALPLFSSTDSSESDKVSEDTSFSNTLNLTLSNPGETSGYLVPNSTEGIIVSGNNINIENTPDNSSINISVDFSLFIDIPDTVWPRVEVGNDNVLVQIRVFDSSNNEVGSSPLYNFTIRSNTTRPTNPWNNAPVSNVFGYFSTYGDKYVFATSNPLHNVLNNTVRLEANNIAHTNDFTVKLYMKSNMEYVYAGFNPMAYTKIEVNSVIGSTVDTSNLSIQWPSGTISGSTITKEKLLKSEISCLDYLLSFSKLFGLYFKKSINEKTIFIYDRNTFFRNNINDWNDRIDYSKDMTISPILFDHKWYLMKYNTPETQYAKRYETDYHQTYGQQRMNTGYNFDSETKELITDNIFDNLVEVNGVSKYFRNYHSRYTGTLAPAWLIDNAEYTLYSDTEEYTYDIFGSMLLNPAMTKEWNKVGGNDVMSKVCLYNLSNDTKNLVEINSSIVFLDGYRELKAINGEDIVYSLTDDIPEMTTLNDGEMCFLWTLSETNSAGDRIAYRLNRLPKFSRYLTSANNVSYSLDIGYPQEWYIPDLGYDPNTVIYSKFWKNFYNDQFNVNTKKVTCFVRLDDLQINNDTLRDIYWFRNAYWILNKIDSYDINSKNTVRCEFIKIQDLNNYLNGVTI